MGSMSDVQTLGLKSAYEAAGFRALRSCSLAWPQACLSSQCRECHLLRIQLLWDQMLTAVWQDVHSECATCRKC